MLYDRFDDMRSKSAGGSGEGYDLTKLGSSVTVQALVPLLKGSKFVGEINTNYSFNIFERALSLSKNFYFSKDLKIGITGTETIGTSSTSFSVAIWNESTLNYDVQLVDTGIVKGSATGTQNIFNFMNDEGTLIIVSNSIDRSLAIAYEINRDTMSLTKYDLTLAESIPSGTSILLNDYFLTALYSSSTKIFRYNFESHSLEFLRTFTSGETPSMERGTPSKIAKINDSIALFVESGNYGLWLCTMNNSSVNFTKTIQNMGQAGFISPNGNILITKDGKIYSINNTTGEGSLITTYSPQTYWGTGSTSTINTIYFINNNTVLIDGKRIYDITNIMNSAPVLLYTTTENYQCTGIYSNYINNKWISQTGSGSTFKSRILNIVQDSNAEYLIQNATGNSIEQNKIYGIVPRNIDTGENGNAQLLWSTITTP